MATGSWVTHRQDPQHASLIRVAKERTDLCTATTAAPGVLDVTWGTWCSWARGHCSALFTGPAAPSASLRGPGQGGAAALAWGHDSHLSPNGTTCRFSFIRNPTAVARKACAVSQSRLLPSGEGMEANLPLVSAGRGDRAEGTVCAWGHCMAARMAELFGRGCGCPLISGQQELACRPLLQGKWPCQEGEG